MRIIVGITGATGTIFGVRALQLLKNSGVELHLVISKWGMRTLLHETAYTIDYVKSLAACTYGDTDQGAAISSGSFVTDGMMVALFKLCAVPRNLHSYPTRRTSA